MIIYYYITLRLLRHAYASGCTRISLLGQNTTVSSNQAIRIYAAASIGVS
jgi:hypothetical protein